MKLSINENAMDKLNKTGLPDLLSVRDTSKLLGICRVSVCKQIALGNIKALKKGRIYSIPKKSIVDFLYKREEDRT